MLIHHSWFWTFLDMIMLFFFKEYIIMCSNVIWLESDTCIFHVFKYSIFILLKWKYKKLTFISTQKTMVQRKSIISILKDRKQNITNLVYFRSWLNLVHSKKYEVWFSFFSKTLWNLSSSCVVSYIHIKSTEWIRDNMIIV